MKTTTVAAVSLSLLMTAPALAQPAPSTDHAGGPTATAGSADQPARAPQSGQAAAPKHKSHKAAPAKTGSAGSASTTQLPNGTGGSTTPSGR